MFEAEHAPGATCRLVGSQRKFGLPTHDNLSSLINLSKGSPSRFEMKTKYSIESGRHLQNYTL